MTNHFLGNYVHPEARTYWLIVEVAVVGVVMVVAFWWAHRPLSEREEREQ